MKNENELNKKPDQLSEDELKEAAGGNDLTNEDSGVQAGSGVGSGGGSGGRGSGGGNGVILVT